MSNPKDATSSWSGYLYQGILALRTTLDYINRFGEEDMSSYLLELEKKDDFSIYCSSSGMTIEKHQVKGLKRGTKNSYQKLIDESRKCETSSSFFLHIANSEVEFDEEYDQFVYKYDTENHCKIGDAIPFLESQVQIYYARLGQNSGEERVKCGCSALQYLVEKKVIDAHQAIHNDEDTDTQIPFKEIEQALDSIPEEGLTRAKMADYLKHEIVGAFYDYCELNECEEHLADRYLKIVKLSDDDFLKFFKKINPHKKIKDLLAFTKGISRDGFRKILFEVLNKSNMELNEKNSIFQKEKSSYLPSTLTSDQSSQYYDRDTKRSIDQIIENVYENEVETLYEANMIITENLNVENIWDSLETRRGFHESDKDIIYDMELVGLIDVEKALGKINE